MTMDLHPSTGVFVTVTVCVKPSSNSTLLVSYLVSLVQQHEHVRDTIFGILVSVVVTTRAVLYLGITLLLAS